MGNGGRPQSDLMNSRMRSSARPVEVFLVKLRNATENPSQLPLPLPLL